MFPFYPLHILINRIAYGLRLCTILAGNHGAQASGRQTDFSFEDEAFQNLVLFAGHTGNLYMSAFDSRENKTVIYRITRK
jgi:hypothetical protein